MKTYKYSFFIKTKKVIKYSQIDKVLRTIEDSLLMSSDINLGVNLGTVSASRYNHGKLGVSMSTLKNTPHNILDQSIYNNMISLIKQKGFSFQTLITDSGRQYSLNSFKKSASSIQDSPSLRTLSNLYSNYSCGQKVMAQRYRMSNPSITTYCPGVINRVISNFYYEIKFNDKTTQILKKNYFFVNNPSNRIEQYNYLSKLNDLYGIGSTVTVNKNYNKYYSPEYMSATITDGSYSEGYFTVKLSDKTILKKVPLSEIYTSCDNITVNDITISQDISEEESLESKQCLCQPPVKFSSQLFVMQNKYILGILFIILTLVTFLIIIYKIFIKYDYLIEYKAQFLIIKNFFLTLVSLATIFLIILLVNKQTINIMNLGILISSLILIWLFTIVFKNQDKTFLYNSFLKKTELMSNEDYLYQLGWSVIFPISIGPFYLLAYLILFIPNLILEQLNFKSSYKFRFHRFFYGQIPGILGNNMALYLAVMCLFSFFYFYLITYFFNGYVDVSNEVNQNGLTSNPVVKLKEIGTGIVSLSKKYTLEVVYLSIILGYLIVKYITPKITQNSTVLSWLNLLPNFNRYFVITLILFYLILLFFIRVMVPIFKEQFNINSKVKLIKFDNDSESFEVGVLDSKDKVLDIKNVLPQDLGKQIFGNITKVISYDKTNQLFEIESIDKNTQQFDEVIKLKPKNLMDNLTGDDKIFKVKKFSKSSKEFDLLTDKKKENEHVGSQIGNIVLIIISLVIIIFFIYSIVNYFTGNQKYNLSLNNSEKLFSSDIDLSKIVSNNFN